MSDLLQVSRAALKEKKGLRREVWEETDVLFFNDEGELCAVDAPDFTLALTADDVLGDDWELVELMPTVGGGVVELP